MLLSSQWSCGSVVPEPKPGSEPGSKPGSKSGSKIYKIEDFVELLK